MLKSRRKSRHPHIAHPLLNRAKQDQLTPQLQHSSSKLLVFLMYFNLLNLSTENQINTVGGGANEMQCYNLPCKPVCTRIWLLAREKMSPMLKALHMSTWKSSRLEEKATQRSSISFLWSWGRLLSLRCEVRWWQVAAANFWAFSRVCRNSSRSFRLSVHPPTHEARCR